MPENGSYGNPGVRSYPNARDCEHGRLRRACEICELLAEIKDLREETDRLQEALHGAWGEAYLGCLEGEDAERACSEVLGICMAAVGVR
jgi:hypothetical protein